MQKEDKISKENNVFIFEKINYILMIAGLLLMALGYILMIGGGSDDPNVFNESIFNTQRITVSPILILLGIIIEIFAIMHRPKQKNGEIKQEEESK